jgi:hypothetical protein
MDKTIEEIRAHVLWSVNRDLQRFTQKAAAYERVQQERGWFGLKQTWASLRLTKLRPRILWWSEIKTAIESNESSQALPALERLIWHYQPENIFLTWLAPLGSAYWDMGLGRIAKAVVSEQIREATMLYEHYQQQTG